MKKNYEIEYLRAIAIGMTLISHLPALLPFHQETLNSIFRFYMPWTGVDLFFCISGFVVSSAYYDSITKHKSNHNFTGACYSFWLRRAYRLIPTAWLWIIIPLLLSILFNSYGSFSTWQQHLTSFTAVATFTGNIANQYGVLLGPNSVYWSLALEEQFYLLFPIFILLTPSKKIQVAIILSLILAQLFIDRNPFGSSASAMASSLRIDAILWGILIFFASKSHEFKRMAPTFALKTWPAKLASTILLIYMLGAISAQLIQMPMAVGLVAMVSAALVYLAAQEQGYIYIPELIKPIAAWLGSRSYGIYVIHVPAYHLATEIWKHICERNGLGYNGGLTAELLLTAAAAIFLLSEINFRIVEQPLRRRGAAIAAKALHYKELSHE